MESLTLTFSAALVMGLVFGAGPCNITCLPYLGPVFLGSEGARPWRVVVPFSLGRLAGYSGLGAVAGGLGYAATSWFENGTAGVILGLATVLAGSWLLMRRRPACKPAAPGNTQTVRPMKRRAAAFPLTLFAMGAGMALNPCAPLGTVLLAAAATAQPVSGASLGLGFGVGAVLIPGALFGLLVAHFGAQVRVHLSRWEGRLQAGAGSLLVALGTFTIFGWVQP